MPHVRYDVRTNIKPHPQTLIPTVTSSLENDCWGFSDTLGNICLIETDTSAPEAHASTTALGLSWVPTFSLRLSDAAVTIVAIGVERVNKNTAQICNKDVCIFRPLSAITMEAAH